MACSFSTEFAASVLRNVETTGGILDDEYAPILKRYIGGSATRQTGDIYQTADQVAAVALATMSANPPPIRTRTSAWGEQLCAFKVGLDPDGSKQQADVYGRFLAE